MPEPSYAALIRTIPDFPTPGVQFKDITTLLQNGPAFRAVIDDLVQPFRHQSIDMVVGVEARGFIFAAPVAHALGAGFVPVRKPGKLPGTTISAHYALEYGTNTLHIHHDAFGKGCRVLLVDDVLATGGTMAATVDLVRRLGGEVVAAAFVIELGFLKGRAQLPDVPIQVLLEY